MSTQLKDLCSEKNFTLDNTTAITSVSLGASIIEKHFTLDRNGGGTDDSFSLQPAEMAALCRDSKTAWDALGRVDYGRKSSEQGNVKFRRSLYFVKDLQASRYLVKHFELPVQNELANATPDSFFPSSPASATIAYDALQQDALLTLHHDYHSDSTPMIAAAASSTSRAIAHNYESADAIAYWGLPPSLRSPWRSAKAGEMITADAVRNVRAGYGAPPKLMEHIIERRVLCDVTANTPVRMEYVGD